MKIKYFTTLSSAILTAYSVSLFAAPGTLSNIPLFVAAPTPPNIFFLLDDSGSMDWDIPSDGEQSSAIINYTTYHILPSTNKEWYAWCPGANLMAYDPSVTYKPWAANIPGTNTPFPNQTNIHHVWVDPNPNDTGNSVHSGVVYGNSTGTVDLAYTPVVTWTDTNGNGKYDYGECPTSFSDTRAVKAGSLSSKQQTNFANWFTYYRNREHTLKSAVTQVIATSSARMGMATLHHNNNVGKPVTDMTNASNKNALLTDVVNMHASGGTPLRQSLNAVGNYFDESSSTTSGNTFCSRFGWFCHSSSNSIYLGTGTYSSPILPASQGGACQQNFVMLMTDGYWNGSSPNVGHQDNPVDNKYVYPAHYDRTPNTLADVAMKWYKTDLAPTLANKVPIQSGNNTQNLDQNSAQHLVTFGIAFGPTGTIGSDPTDRTKPFSWPVPQADHATTVDDLRHAAYDGRGKFLSAKKPQSLIKALQDAVSTIQAREGSSSAVSFNTTSLTNNTSLYYASFNTSNWTGNLQAFQLDPSTGAIVGNSFWSAASLLDARTNNDMKNNRVIYTWGTDSSGNPNGVLFNGSLTTPQIDTSLVNDLKINGDATTDTSPFTESTKRLDYLRGDMSYDGTGLYRTRTSRLGDIIDSAPVYVGAPVSNWPNTSTFGGASYSTYQANLQTSPRTPMVYVGANDGLLHGFSADTGQEVMAYAPKSDASSSSKSGLHYLTESGYQHKYYVDGTITSSDVYIKTSPTGSKSWRTILVGSLHGGGQGIYALDVTDPSQFTNTQAAAANTVLWEFTDQDDPDLGFSFSTPQVAMMNNGEWAVITGNGYNSSGTDKAKLFIIFIEKGVDGQWSPGDYLKLDTGVGTPTNKNGLSTPTLVDLDNNGTIDRIYAGDLQGNLWAFDVSSTNSASWKVANTDASGNPAPLFAAGSGKPITMKPLVIKPDVSWIPDVSTNKPNMMVYFGTGQYLTTSDVSNTNQQTFYGIWDAGTPVQSSSLVQQTFEPSATTNTRVLTQNAVTYQNTATGQHGWYINLPDPGERVVVNALEYLGLIYFNTMTPSSTPCSAGGSSWQMAVDEKTGGNPGFAPFDLNNDGVFNASDLIVSGKQFNFGIASQSSLIKKNGKTTVVYTSGTDNSGGGTGSNKPHMDTLPPTSVPATGQRKSWVQLFNE